MKEPLFSILIANFNNGPYLKDAINSVLSQTYKNWEIVIVDDASTDNSKDIYNEYSSNNKIRIYYNQQNKGCTYTKWRCLEYAKGDICGFLDADDVILPNTISIMVNEHLNDENISIISSRYYICDENLNIKSESGYLVIPNNHNYFTNMKYAPWPFISFKLLKYKQTKGINKYNKVGDDQELCLLLEEVGKWKILNEITYKYRQRKESYSHTNENLCNYWNLIVYHETCVRRGLNPNNYSYNTFLDFLNNYALEKIYKFQEESKVYKLGAFFVKPYYIIKRFLHIL